MSNDVLASLQASLEADPGDGESEWEMIREALEKEPEKSSRILEWVFREHHGYIQTRSAAGLYYYRQHPSSAWSILEQLVSSRDPDDRDTALTVLASIGSDKGYQLVYPLLRDPYPYIQLEAARFLAAAYPDEVRTTLAQLSNHREGWVREEAIKLTIAM